MLGGTRWQTLFRAKKRTIKYGFVLESRHFRRAAAGRSALKQSEMRRGGGDATRMSDSESAPFYFFC
jgi:hypothetical protein